MVWDCIMQLDGCMALIAALTSIVTLFAGGLVLICGEHGYSFDLRAKQRAGRTTGGRRSSDR